jgi:hypothetical protein
MRVEDVKINPRKIELLMETLDLVKEEKRVEYIDSLVDQVEQDIDKAQHYAESQGVDYQTALKQVMVGRPLASFCKDGC